jgi:hypothetical protein
MSSGQAWPRDGDSIALASEALVAFGCLRLRVTGSSMLPALRPGDEIELRSCPASRAEVGDIVLFRREAAFVVHRVLECNDHGLVTQGDSLPAPDPPVEHADVLGRVVGLTRGSVPVAIGRSFGPGHRCLRWLFRRFDLSTRLFLRWQRISARAIA